MYQSFLLYVDKLIINLTITQNNLSMRLQQTP